MASQTRAVSQGIIATEMFVDQFLAGMVVDQFVDGREATPNARKL
jgi:hypothetical protein